MTAADVIVHVRDIAGPESKSQRREVLQVLEDLGLIEAEGLSKVPIVEVWNKWDLLSAERAAELQEIIDARPDEIIVPASALTGVGSSDVLERIGAMLTTEAKLHEFVVPASDGQRLAWLHAHGEVIDENEAGEDEQGPQRRLTVRLTPRELGRYIRL